MIIYAPGCWVLVLILIAVLCVREWAWRICWGSTVFILCAWMMLASSAHAAEPDGMHAWPGSALIPVTDVTTLPPGGQERPITAVAVVGCGGFIAAFITYSDGHMDTFDIHNPWSADGDTSGLRDLIESAGSYKVLDIVCTESKQT